MTFYTTIIWMFYASRTYFKHFKKNVFLFKRISPILTPYYKKVGKFTKKEIANICPSISEKSVEAALRKLVDEQYIERHGTGKNSFYAKVSS